MDANPDNQSATTEDGSHVLADTPTGIAAERKDNRGRLLFVAHEHKNEVRVFDAQTGKRLSSFSSPGPTHLAATTWEQSYEYSSVWVVEKNVNRSEGAPAHVVRKYKSTVEQWANGTYVPTSTVLPNVSIPLSISTVQAPVAFGRTYIPNVRGVIVVRIREYSLLHRDARLCTHSCSLPFVLLDLSKNVTGLMLLCHC